MPNYHPDQFPPEFVEKVVRANQPEVFGVHRFPRGLSAGAVEAMTPEEHAFTIHHAAVLQRGHPEDVMHEVQKVAGGGIYSWLAEHVGDLTHRLNQEGGVFGTEFAAPKVDRALGTLEQGYGVEREHLEQMASNRTDLDALREVGTRYHEAHSGLPTYNQPSESARGAAMAVGRADFSTAALHLRSLQRQMSDPDKFKYLMSQQGSVEFLRKREERGY